MTNKTPRENLSTREQAEELLADENYDGDMSADELILLRALCEENKELERMRDKYQDGLNIANASCKRRGEMIDQLKAKLEAAKNYNPYSGEGCLLCEYEEGKLIKPCGYHKEKNGE